MKNKGVFIIIFVLIVNLFLTQKALSEIPQENPEYPGAIWVSAEESQTNKKKFNPEDLIEVFIGKTSPVIICGRLKDRSIIGILTLNDLPKEMDGFGSVKGFPLKASSFLHVSTSSDNTKIAFTVSLSETFHCDSGGWSGVLDLKDNKIIQLGTCDKDYLEKIALSPSGRYLLEEYDGFFLYPFEYPYRPIIIMDVKTRKTIFCMGDNILTKKHIKKLGLDKLKKEEYIKAQFTKFTPDEKSIYFKLIKVKEKSYEIEIGDRIYREYERIEEENLGTWAIDLEGTNFRKIKKE